MFDNTKKNAVPATELRTTTKTQSQEQASGFGRIALVEQLVQRLQSAAPESMLQPQQDLHRLRQLVGPLKARQLLERETDEPEEPTESLLDIDYHFAFDYDGDGQKEQKRLYFKQVGSHLEFIINPDPVPFEEFVNGISVLKNDATIAQDLDDLQLELFKTDNSGKITSTRRAIGQSSGQTIRGLLLKLANRINHLKADAEKPVTVVNATTTQISYSGTSETINNGLTADPLTTVPPANSFWTGYKPRVSNTPFMQALNKVGAYVRGHMLNGQLHGPGEDENLVPISSETNSQMEKKLEHPLKDLVNGKNRVLYYKIKPRSTTLNTGNGFIDQLPQGFDATYGTYTYSGSGARANLANWTRGALTAVPIDHTASLVPRANRSWNKAPEKLIGPGIYTAIAHPRGEWPALESDGRISSPGGLVSRPAQTVWSVEKFPLWTLRDSANPEIVTEKNTYFKSNNSNPIVEEAKGLRYSIMPTDQEVADLANTQVTKSLPYIYQLDDKIWTTYNTYFNSYDKARVLVEHHLTKSSFSAEFYQKVCQKVEQGYDSYEKARNVYDATLDKRRLYGEALVDVEFTSATGTSDELLQSFERLTEAQDALKKSRSVLGRTVGYASAIMQHAQQWHNEIEPLMTKYKDQLAQATPQQPTIDVTTNADVNSSPPPQPLLDTTLNTGMQTSSAMQTVDNSSVSAIQDALTITDLSTAANAGHDDEHKQDDVQEMDYIDRIEQHDLEEAKRLSEQSVAIDEGIADFFIIGHAHGDANACFISSLLQHAKGLGSEAEPSKQEVEQVRLELVKSSIIKDQEEIDIASEGEKVIEYIKAKYDPSLKVIALLNGRPDVETPISDGTKEAIIYLAPGHFIPVWRKIRANASSVGLSDPQAPLNSGLVPSQSNLSGIDMDIPVLPTTAPVLNQTTPFNPMNSSLVFGLAQQPVLSLGNTPSLFGQTVSLGLANTGFDFSASWEKSVSKENSVDMGGSAENHKKT